MVSSLVVQHYLGGELIRYKVTGENIDEAHYCNQLDNGTLVDTTASQYQVPVTLISSSANLRSYSSLREKRLADPDTRKRYDLLPERVEQKLAKTS